MTDARADFEALSRASYERSVREDYVVPVDVQGLQLAELARLRQRAQDEMHREVLAEIVEVRG